MRKAVLVFLAFALSLAAANLKLYMKDGGFQLVREYRIEGDRIKYYSVERSDWEEMPADLVDLKRTDAEAAAKEEDLDRHAQMISEEDQVAAELRREIMKIPQDPGVYRLENNTLRIFKLADASVHDNKRRTILQHLTPVPVVSGKSTLETPGEHSQNVVTDERPEFYIQLSLTDSFAIVKLTPLKGYRIVEHITVEPVVNIYEEEREVVPTFTKQLTESGLYKIWPQDALPKGEYAVIEYNEGKIDARIWDFRVQ